MVSSPGPSHTRTFRLSIVALRWNLLSVASTSSRSISHCADYSYPYLPDIAISHILLWACRTRLYDWRQHCLTSLQMGGFCPDTCTRTRLSSRRFVEARETSYPRDTTSNDILAEAQLELEFADNVPWDWMGLASQKRRTAPSINFKAVRLSNLGDDFWCVLLSSIIADRSCPGRSCWHACSATSNAT